MVFVLELEATLASVLRFDTAGNARVNTIAYAYMNRDTCVAHVLCEVWCEVVVVTSPPSMKIYRVQR